MEFRQLNTFVTVAKLNNFTKSAAYLGYSQSAVTAQIQQLEEELKVHLFERLGKSISLTSEGEKFLVYAKQILKLCDEAKNTLVASDILKGNLTIGATESLCAVRLPQLLQEFHQRYPAVEITLKRGNRDECQTLLRENQIDVAFIIGQKLNVTEFVTELELPEPLVLLSTTEHPLTFKKNFCFEDIAEYTIIVAEKGCSFRNLFEKNLDDAGVTPKSIMETSSIQAIKQFTKSGLGISLLPRIAVEEELGKKQLTELHWDGADLHLSTLMVYHKDKWISPILKAFMDLTKEMLN